MWGESLSVSFQNGYYSVVLGSDTANSLTDDVLSQSNLYLELQINNDPPLQPRKRILANPYARQADVATNVDGGVINATEFPLMDRLYWTLELLSEPVTPNGQTFKTFQ